MAQPQLLAGRYALSRELGRGASGRVLLAVDTHEGDAPRALKLVAPAHEARLRWEFGLLARIDHPGLARVYELLRVDRPLAGVDLPVGSLVLVSELASGKPLSALIAGSALDADERLALALTVGDGVARALAALHAQGLMHGDVKPDNVIVEDEHKRCKLIDLGLASEVGANGPIGGTPGYMAPELLRGERGPAADLYALGATLHAVLSGADVEGDSSDSTARRDVFTLGAGRHALAESIPLAMRRLIASLLEGDATVRTQRAGEVSAAIALIAREAGHGLGMGVGGGADDVPTSAERAQAMGALPLVGHGAALDALTADMSRAGVCVVQGPHGAGRSRLVREAVRRLQTARAAAGLAPPNYRAVSRLPDGELSMDCVLHVLDADAISADQANALLLAADVEGRTLALVLERTSTLPACKQHEVLVQPLAEGEVRRLLEHALPGARVTPALTREALTSSGGLSGRLCRVLAQGLAAGTDMSRQGSFAALGASHAADVSALPESARDLVELLAAAGGELMPLAAHVALGSATALAEAQRLLLASGLCTRSGDRLCLRADLTAALRGTLRGARLIALAARLPENELDGRARAHLWLARQQPQRALPAFEEEVARLRAQGLPEQAALCAREGLNALCDFDAASRGKLLLGLADALRAQGSYAEAQAVLCDPLPPHALVLRAELHRLSGDRVAASATAEQVLDGATDQAVAAEAEALLARLAYDEGDLPRAQRLAESAQARAPANPQAEPSALRAAEVLVLVALHRAERERAASLLAPALALSRQARLRASEARLTSLWAELARLDGDPHTAAKRFAVAFELADAVGEQHASAAFLHNVGVQRLDAGELGPAIAALREAARRLARLGREADLARALYNLAHAAQFVGADDVALSSALRAYETAERAGDTSTSLSARCLEAELRLKLGDRKTVTALLARPRDLAALPPSVAATVAARCAALHLALGDEKAAERNLAEADAAAQSAGSESSLLEPLLVRCLLELERGHSDAARAAAERAHGLAAVGASLDARLRAALLSARAARAGGDAAVAALRLSEVRSMLDHAARGLSSSERARLRAVDAYRAAFEAVPSAAMPTALNAADDRWRVLAGMAKRLTGERRVRRLHEIVLDAAVELSGAERGYLVLQDRDGEARVRAGRGLVRRDVAGADFTLSRSIVARVLGSGRALSTMDAASDDRLTGAASVHALSLRSVLAVPLQLRGATAGAIYLEDRLRPFAFGEIETLLLSDLADLASIALESAELLRSEKRAARRLAILRLRLARKVEAQEIELDSLKRTQDGGQSHNVGGIIGHSAPMQRVLALVARVARAEVPVLLRGESGSGKELLARAIHDSGPRKAAPFISENCGAIPEPLLESALFGHVRGAFTGADKRRQGLFEVADGGTLFLDEIGEMSPAMQARFLRVLQDGEVRPVGGERSVHVNVRVLAATHRDLEAMVAAGTFREDLYYRLAVVTLKAPALRERPEDIAPLVAHFIAKHAQGRKVELDRRVLSALTRHPWPGNVRQLENEIRRALVLADDVIALEHLSPSMSDLTDNTAEPLDLRAQVDHLERSLIRQALESCAGNQTRAARLLGVSRFGLQKMIRRLEMGDDAAPN